MELPKLLAEQFDISRRWSLSLVGDLTPAECDVQLRDELQNVHWILGHLLVAENALIFRRCFGTDELDPDFARPFGRGQILKADDKNALPPLNEVRHEMDRVHGLAVDAVLAMGPDDLSQPVLGEPHPRFTTRQGAICHASRHEAFHAGQIAFIRRLLGKSFLR